MRTVFSAGNSIHLRQYGQVKIAFRRGVGGVAAVAAATLALSFAIPVQATTTDTLDPSAYQWYSNGNPVPVSVMAQTFTPSMSGQIDRVRLQIYAQFNGWAKFTVGIQKVKADGTPSGTNIGTPYTWMNGLPCCAFHDFPVSAPITKGTQYAIVVQRLVTPIYWKLTTSSTNPTTFSGGKLYVSSCTSGCTWYSGTGFGKDFAFEVWVASAAANTPPSLALNSQNARVNEGTAPSMTGTFSDPDGDTVTLSATGGGQVTPASGTGSGTWTWTEPAGDEAPGQTITINADDGHGGKASAPFNVDVVGVAPTAQILTDPVSVPEGAPVPFTGAATSPDAADTAAGFTFGWTVTKDGNPFATGSGSSFNFTPNDEGTYDITFSATDDGAMTGTTSMTVIGTNVPPTAMINPATSTVSQLVYVPQQLLSFSGSFTAPGTADKHTVVWDFGDGSHTTTNLPAGGGQGVSTTHAYANAGTYHVTLSVADGEGGTGAASTTVNVLTPQQALSAISGYMQKLSGLNKGQKNGLQAKLDAASASIARGDSTSANNQLNAFLHELNADANTGKVSANDLTVLSNAVHALQGALGTYNRFLEWWPLEP